MAQLVWAGAVFIAWVLAMVAISLGGGTFESDPDHVEAWMALASVAALALAPVPTVAFILSTRRR